MANKVWIRLWKDEDFRGASKLLEGPRDWPNLNDLDGENWHDEVLSVELGPEAIAQCSHDENYGGKEVVYGPYSRIRNTGADMRREFDSIKLSAYNDYPG